uniref:Uncharacterized protein n=1 Tax=Rhizophora mucronata TaxID=61149 RepID=A0A2P2KH44_RHIMU
MLSCLKDSVAIIRSLQIFFQCNQLVYLIILIFMQILATLITIFKMII